MTRTAVLTISDSSFSGTRKDLSGPAVALRLRDQGFEVVVQEILPDDADVIAGRLIHLADSSACEAVFTTGGTGVALRDVTPEATRRAIDKEIPGLGELMRAEGAKKTPLAVLSRSMAGTRGRVLIVNLPGSPRGAVESLDAILKLVPHIVGLLHGETGHPTDLKLNQKG